MGSSLITKVSFPAALVLFLAGCQTSQQHAASIGEAFVGPAVLSLRSDIPLESKTVATVKHGDRLELLQHRRKFLRVRSPNGSEGWVDERNLLAAADMEALKALSVRAAKLPSQGAATTYGDLRVHTTPSVQAPSFLVIQNGEKFDVLAHLVVPRTDIAHAALIPPVPKKKAISKKKESKGKYPLPPMPKPPPLPADWLDLSKSDLSKAEPEPEAEAGPKAVPSDNWSLVRTSSGQSGWVLTRRLSMAIPDDVAQYAEGHRIVSYFAVGSVQDGDEKKSTWLWTTMGGGGQSFDFDSFRVFVWSLRHHRYETAYIQRTVEGYEPVLLREVDLGGGKGKGVAAGKYPGFSVCVVNRGGQKVRQEFAMLGNTVRFAGELPCQDATPPLQQQTAAALPGQSAAAPQAKESWWQRLKKRLHR